MSGRDASESPALWRPVSLLRLIRARGVRDPRVPALLASWLLLGLGAGGAALLCDALGLYDNALFAVGGLAVKVCVFPPLLIAALVLLWLGLDAALAVVVLGTALYGAASGLSGAALVLFSGSDALPLLLLAAGFHLMDLRIDLRDRRSLLAFLPLAVLAAVSSLPGGIVWVLVRPESHATVARVLWGWLNGALVGLLVIVGPLLWLAGTRPLELRDRYLPYAGAPFPTGRSFVVTALGVGLTLGGFIVGIDLLLTGELAARSGDARALAAGLAMTRLFTYVVGLILLVLAVGLVLIRQRWARELSDTLRRRTEKLRESAETVAALIRCSPAAIIHVDPRGRVRLWNPAAEKMFGWTAAEVIGERPPFIPPGREREFDDNLRRALEGETGTSSELHRQRKDGSEIVLDLNVARIVGEDGAVRGLFGIMTDVTERRRWMRQLELLRSAIEHASEAVAILDERGRVRYANQAYADMIGATKQDIEGLRDFVVLEAAGSARATRLLEHMRCGQEWNGRVRARGGSGAGYEAEVSVSPVGDDQTDGRTFIAVSRDITERLALESQLRQAQKMEAVGQLAGGVAHDFNNLLQGIRGYSQLALQEDLPLQVREDLESVVEASRRAEALVRQLLLFSRRERPQPAPTDLNRLIGGTTGMLQRMIGENYRLVQQLGPDLAPVLVDRGQLEQVLMNLCLNARDAMAAGGPITIRTWAAEPQLGDAPDAQWVAFSVADQGRGISEEIRGRVFEPFFTTKDPGKGTGLGLSTVYGIVQEHGGRIELESEPGAGATFAVYLPADARARDVLPPPRLEGVRGGHETILLAEDSELVRKFAVRVLSGAGYRVRVAADGREALAAVAEIGGSLDLAVLDLVMPDASGQEVRDRLLEAAPSVPVVFATGYSTSLLEPGFAEAPGVQLLRKPYAAADLLAAVRRGLDQGRDVAGPPGATTGTVS